MKKTLLILITTYTIIANVYCQENFLPIDSLYMKSIEMFYNNAQKSKDNIWQGMNLSPVCLYRVNGPAFLYNHPNPPKSFSKISEKLYVGSQNEVQLLGGTQVDLNEILTAIVDYGLDHYSTTDEVFAELFHEMHHVYQRNEITTIAPDNPAILLNYPEDYKNDAIKLFEQTLLHKMCFTKNKDDFRNIPECLNFLGHD